MDAYATTTFGDTYFENILRADAWDDADAATQTKALKESTLWIDGLNFKGQKADADQERQFPRGTDTTVPEAVQQACCDLALVLLDGIEVEMEMSNQRLVSSGYSSVRATYDRSKIDESVMAGIPSMAAWRKLIPYLRTADAVTIRRV